MADSGKRDHKRLQAALQQTAVRLLEEALAVIEAREPLGEAEVVHRLRVAMKRLRALLRLLRSSLPASGYRALNARCRELAGRLAEDRDAEVAQATLRRLLADSPAQASRVRLLAALAPAQDSECAAPRPSWQALAEELAALQRICSGVALPGISRRRLRQALQNSYREGARLGRRARKIEDTELLHEWRKAVKRVYYQNQLLRERQNRHLRQLKTLSDCLGDLHDLDMLEQRLLAQRHRYWRDDLDLLQPRLDAARRRLYRKALKQGNKVFGRRDLKQHVRRVVKASL
jgi:CHAD domain-containing protein